MYICISGIEMEMTCRQLDIVYYCGTKGKVLEGDYMLVNYQHMDDIESHEIGLNH
jgi:hypothetical protein